MREKYERVDIANSSKIVGQPLENPEYSQMKLNDYRGKNTIYLDCEIDREIINLLARQLKKLGDEQLELTKSKRQPIKIIISSYGGCAYSTLYFCDLIKYYVAKGVEIHGYVTSVAMSGAFKILICCSKRFGYRHSLLMCHQFNTYKGGHYTYQDMVNEREQDDRLYKTLKELIVENTDITEELMDSYTEQNRDFFMNSEEALKLRVIDEIII